MPDRRRRSRTRAAATIALLIGLTGGAGLAAQRSAAPRPRPPAPPTVRLYIFDCGVLGTAGGDPRNYHLTKDQVAETRMSVPCFLIVHPQVTLMWDLGVVPDSQIPAMARNAMSPPTLVNQLAAIGYSPADITYVAISHAHRDHSANGNDFVASTWLARPAERDFMFTPNNPRVDMSFYDKLKTSKTILINTDEYDVFGDGKVVLKSAPGHTPGMQVLIVHLAKTGPVMLSGDLYHYPEERTLHTAPPDNEQGSVQQSQASRAMIEEYLKKTKTQLWIEHDFVANAKLKKAPNYYE